MKYLLRRAGLAAAVAAVMCVWGAPDAQAMSLGPLRVLSKRGDPLLAEVDIPQLTSQEMAIVRAGLGTPQEYVSSGMTFDPSLQGVQIILLRRADGRYFLRLTGTKPVTAESLNVILQLQAGAASVWRDYLVQVQSPEPQTQTLALGLARVLSRRGEPLRAEIDVPMVPSGESPKAGVASAAEYAAAGIPYDPALGDVQMRMQKREDGKSFLSVTTAKPVNEASLNLVMDATWSAGRIVRDYSLPLQPQAQVPALAQRESSGSVTSVAAAPLATPPSSPPAPPTASAAMAAPVPVPAPAPAVAPAPPAPAIASAPAPAPAPELTSAAPAPIAVASPPPAFTRPPVAPPPAQTAAASIPPAAPTSGAAPAVKPATPASGASVTAGEKAVEKVVVKAGDTASRIALAHKPLDVSLDQMLVATLKANASAFAGGNVNRLRAGAVLSMPSEAQAASVAPDEATRVLALQTRDFEEFRLKLAESARPAPAGQTANVKNMLVTKPVVRNRLALTNPAVGAPKDPAYITQELNQRAERAAQLTQEMRAMATAQGVIGTASAPAVNAPLATSAASATRFPASRAR